MVSLFSLVSLSHATDFALVSLVFDMHRFSGFCCTCFALFGYFCSVDFVMYSSTLSVAVQCIFMDFELAWIKAHQCSID